MENPWSLVGDESLEIPVLLSVTESAADIYVNWMASGKAKKGMVQISCRKENPLLHAHPFHLGCEPKVLCLPTSVKAIRTVRRYGCLLR